MNTDCPKRRRRRSTLLRVHIHFGPVHRQHAPKEGTLFAINPAHAFATINCGRHEAGHQGNNIMNCTTTNRPPNRMLCSEETAPTALGLAIDCWDLDSDIPTGNDPEQKRIFEWKTYRVRWFLFRGEYLSCQQSRGRSCSRLWASRRGRSISDETDYFTKY